MSKSKLDLLQGTLDLMVLQTLVSMGPQHGYGIARRIEQVSGNEVLLNQGTIYASLVRLQERRWISAEWGTSDNNRKAKFYSITKKGRKTTDRGRRVLAASFRCDGPGAGDAGRTQMNWVKLILQRLRSSFSHPQIDRELDMEMASHLEIAIEDNLKQGMSAEEARRQAFIRFGGVEQAKQQHREARGFQTLDILLQDLRYTFRTLRSDPGSAALATLILALGIGANIAVFSVVNTILLQPLPFHDPQQLVWITGIPGRGGLSSQTYSTDAYKAFLSQQRSFQDVTGYFAFSPSDNTRLMRRGEPLLLSGILVNGNFFQTLGVQPILG